MSNTSVKEQFAELEMLAKRLASLLERPERGLMSWGLAVVQTIKRISEIGKEMGIV